MGFYLDSIATAEKRLNNEKNILSPSFKFIGQGSNPNRGSSEGTVRRQLSVETKGLVAALAEVSGVKETAKAFGLSPVVTSQFKNGKIASGEYADPELRKSKATILDSITASASNLVQNSIGLLSSPDRLANAKTSELTQIAAVAMSIVEKSRPANANLVLAGRICFMVPPARQEQDYDVIDVVPTRED